MRLRKAELAVPKGALGVDGELEFTTAARWLIRIQRHPNRQDIGKPECQAR